MSALGYFADLVIYLGPWVIPILCLVVLLITDVPVWYRRWVGPGVEVRPISGDKIAKLGVRNITSATLHNVSVQIIGSVTIIDGVEKTHPWLSLSAERGDAFLLRWSKEHGAAEGARADIQPDNELLVDVCAIDPTRQAAAPYCAASPSINPPGAEVGQILGVAGGYPDRVTIRVATDKGALDAEFVIYLHPKPGPITIAEWSSMGQQVIADARDENERLRRERDAMMADAVEIK